MAEFNRPENLESAKYADEEGKHRRAKGEFGKFLEKAFKEQHDRLAALSKHKLIDAGIEDNEAANESEDIVSVAYKDMLNNNVSIDLNKSEPEIQANLAKILDETISRYLKTKYAKRRISSSELVKTDELTQKERMQIAKQDDFLETIGNVPLAEILEEDLNKISPREKKAIKMRFGLAPYEKDHTLDEVAFEFAVTRERIRQIVAKGLRKLKNAYESRKFVPISNKEQIKPRQDFKSYNKIIEERDQTPVEVDPEIFKKSTDIIDLGPVLTAKFQKVCFAKNIQTIEQLISHSRISLRAAGFGDKSSKALNKWLKDRGLSLRKTTWDMTEEELLHSPEAIKQDWDIEFNLEDLFLKISDLKDRFIRSEPAKGEEIINILIKAGKITVFNLLEERFGTLEDLFNWNETLVKPLRNFFLKNYNIEIGYCSPGTFDQITRWYNAKSKSSSM